jgi:hypothetical protein
VTSCPHPDASPIRRRARRAFTGWFSGVGRRRQAFRALQVAWGGLAAVLLSLDAVAAGAGEAEIAGPAREQTIPIRAGWNAVFLEVYPEESAPSRVFEGSPFEIVGAYYDRPGQTQFVTDPRADLFKWEGWSVWYADDRPDAALTTLHAIHGQQAYLIHSKSDYVWRVRGVVGMAETRWRADSFNFVGFPVSATAPPTFAEFFAGSPAHRHNRIYRLVNGAWKSVTDPAQEAMRSGEAFWIYCDGASRYEGPLKVEASSRAGVALGRGVSSLILRNASPHPVQPTVRHVPISGDPAPLAIVIQVNGDPAAPVRRVPVPKLDGAWTQELPPLEAGAAVRMPLTSRREAMTAPVQVSLLKVESDLGTETWVPVIATREDLEER